MVQLDEKNVETIWIEVRTHCDENGSSTPAWSKPLGGIA